MFIPLVIATSILIALARGGRFSNLSQLRLRFVGFLFAPLVIQLVAFSPLGDRSLFGASLAQYLYIASMGLAVVAVWLNRHLPGLKWIAAGLFLNSIVIGLNGGVMPSSATAREIAGLPPLVGRDMNVVPLNDSTILPWLGDILPLPSFVPFANVFSVGDLFIVIGGIIFTQRALISPRRKIDQFPE
jgi:hypothetical protein